MKTYKYQIILILTLIFVSCQDELEINDKENSQSEVAVAKKIENGRFVFLSKESLKLTIDNFQSDGIENVEQEFKKLYEKGFRSHKPILGSQNEQLRAKFTEEILSRRENSKSSTTYYRNTGSTEDEEAEEFISDPLLASLVNENNEIIVNDTLYKFTKEKGVYFAHINDSTYLLNYFEGEFESNAQLTIDIESERELYGGYTDVDEKIGRFVRPNLQHAPLNEGGSGGLSSGPIPQLLNEEQLNDIVNNLPVCDGNASGNWFQNIFGTSYVCRSYFSDTRRIKTEFWDQNWGIYKSVGILTKTQKKLLGFGGLLIQMKYI